MAFKRIFFKLFLSRFSRMILIFIKTPRLISRFEFIFIIYEQRTTEKKRKLFGMV